MISWIQRYFQRHFKLVFGLLLLIMAIPLIWVFNPSSGMGRGDRRGMDRPFFGYNLGSQEDQRRLMTDADLSFNLNPRYDVQSMEAYAFQRAAALHLANEWHIPAASTAELREAITKLRAFTGQTGQFDTQAYQKFLENLKTKPAGMNGGLTEGDVARVLGDDVRVQKVTKLLSGPGYVLPGDVKLQLTRSDTMWTLATATADYTAFKPEIKPTDAEIAKAFEESGTRYDIPPRIVVSYVDFPAANYLAQVTLTDAEVRAYYDANPGRFPKTETPAPNATPTVAPAADPNADFAAVRPKVEEALKAERAKALALRDASKITLALYNAKPANGAALDTFLAENKLTAKLAPPFTRDAAPAELGGSPEVAAEAFRLNPERLYTTDAVRTPNGAVLMFWKELQPSRKPLLAEVKEKVAADYIETERRKRFVELGRAAKTQLETRLKAGDTLDKAVTAVTNPKLEAKSIPAFSRRTPPQDLDYSIQGQLERLEQGQLSDMVLTQDGSKGIFVYVAEKKAPDLNESNPRFAELRGQLAAYTANSAATAYLSELVEKELKRTEPKVQ